MLEFEAFLNRRPETAVAGWMVKFRGDLLLGFMDVNNQPK
jgi:hypothetical protein